MIAVPTGASRFILRMTAFVTRTHPCETAPGRTPGLKVPWIPTLPPPGQSDSLGG